MKTLRKSRSSAAIALAIAGLLAASLLTPTGLHAQASAPATADQKMQLMVDALAARDAGDLAKAKELLTQLQAVAPNDNDVKRNLADINADIVRQSQGKPTVFGPAASAAAMPAGASVATRPVGASAPATAQPAQEAQASLQAQAAKQKQQVATTGQAVSEARALIAAGNYDQAREVLADAQAKLPPGIGYNQIQADIKQQIAESYYQEAVSDYKAHKNVQAIAALKSYTDLVGDDSRSANLEKSLAGAQTDPTRQDIDVVSPGFATREDKIRALLTRGRAQYLYGDYSGALQTFGQVIINDPDSTEAKAYENHINQLLFKNAYINHENTRNAMLLDVSNQWIRPDVYLQQTTATTGPNGVNPVTKKLGEISIPRVSFDNIPLDRVANTLGELSVDYDTSTPPDGFKGTWPKGVNINVIPPPNGATMPKVSVNFRGLSLQQILSNVCKQSGYTFAVENSVVTLRQGEEGGAFETLPFPMSQATLTRVTGYHGASGSGGAADPFGSTGAATSGNTTAGEKAAPAPVEPPPAETPSGSGVEDSLQSFFVRAGVDFPSGAKLAYDGSKIYVTNTPKNLERLGNLLRTYTEIKQVEIESRFLDVQQGALQELGMRWNINSPHNTNDFFMTGNSTANSTLRQIGTAFPLGNSGAQPTVVTGLATVVNGFIVPAPPLSIPQVVPTLPNSINVGSMATDMFSGIMGVYNGYKINMILNALDQTQGTDLMSAPKVTVLSQKTATITIAQILKYPTTFGAIQSQVSPASGNSGTSSGSGGVTITAGTPTDFQDEQIGVVMEVTPTVEDDDSISLRLDPKVTEFEGFIEYGGTSLAIQAGTTASVPSGFIQPIFDVRQVRTEVTIFDGATVVMGGLTRDEVKTVNDKIPILGDIPFLGRLFQSKGETSQKRNLMIFVTANLISPGGSPAKQPFQNLPPGTLFQNPTIVTPSRSVRRTVVEVPVGESGTTAPQGQ